MYMYLYFSYDMYYWAYSIAYLLFNLLHIFYVEDLYVYGYLTPVITIYVPRVIVSRYIATIYEKIVYITQQLQ